MTIGAPTPIDAIRTKMMSAIAWSPVLIPV
jgi:hypothetical protein